MTSTLHRKSNPVQGQAVWRPLQANRPRTFSANPCPMVKALPLARTQTGPPHPEVISTTVPGVIPMAQSRPLALGHSHNVSTRTQLPGGNEDRGPSGAIAFSLRGPVNRLNENDCQALSSRLCNICLAPIPLPPNPTTRAPCVSGRRSTPGKPGPKGRTTGQPSRNPR